MFDTEKSCKNAYNPYAKGRWYRFFIESDGESIKITEMDLEVQHSSSYLQMPEGFHIVDTKHDIHTVSGGNAANMSHVLRVYADGRQGVILPNKDNFDYGYIYVFGYFD